MEEIFEDEIPQVEKIPVYKQERYENLKSKFTDKFGKEPEYFVRAPGRVNIIGEHIDYCGYSVLPMAIEQDVVFTVINNTNSKVLLTNTNPQYKDFECDINNLNIPKDDPQWYNYVLCGIKGILEHIKKDNGTGFTCLIDGTIPPSAGLSSSSALVCCAALTTMYANGASLTKKDLADICAHCEHYIGTEGGGMDQAICFMAKQGTAKLIEFNPLKATDVDIPCEAVFVISNSCVKANKAATSNFNIRVVECRIATRIMAKNKGLDWRQVKKLADLQLRLEFSLEQMLDVVKETFHKEPYNKSEICELLGITSEELTTTSLSQNTLEVDVFKLYDRASHVYSEANRVLQFEMLCHGQLDDSVVGKLGKLMNASHNSCRDLYECSHPDLDDLVEICRKSGAVGSRLTGAGWGGCAVSMVKAGDAVSFLAKVRDQYYKPHPDRAQKILKSLFASEPGPGAAIYKPSL